ncbi:hypothetical protein KEM55_003284, partial [Ascosphaera atra]
MPQTRSSSFSASKRKRVAEEQPQAATAPSAPSATQAAASSAAANAQLQAEVADAVGTTSTTTPQQNVSAVADNDDTDADKATPAKRLRKEESSGQGREIESQSVADSSVAEEAVLRRQSGDDADSGLPIPVSKTKPMRPPPKAGMVDPVGYKTNPPPQGRPVRVYADGVFDLFHLGHMRALEQCKTAFPDVHLIVGVTGDEETHRRKGLTVLSAAERAESVRHCKWVDEVVPDCPWVVTPAFLDEHRIDYVAHDDLPYAAAEGDDVYAPIKKQGKFLVTQRTEGVSTTGIITTIVRDYDKYISRQLKRGTTRQELNVSWLKKNELEIKRHVAELRDTIKNNWSNTQELGKELRSLWQNSRPNSPRLSADNMGRGLNKARDYFQHRLEFGNGNGNGENGPDFATGYSLGLMGGVRSW